MVRPVIFLSLMSLINKCAPQNLSGFLVLIFQPFGFRILV
jgi:hypothetical protein